MIRFFYPNKRFWNWLRQLAPDSVLDCGCGDGALVEAMHRKGIKALGCDPRYLLTDELPPDKSNYILPATGENLVGDLAGTAILCCRPCHDGFPMRVLLTMHPEASFYYVGLDSNLARDFDLDRVVLRRALLYAGRDDEHVYQVTLKS